MTRVDFYLLNDAHGDKQQFACRLADKTYRLGHRSYLLTAGAGEAAALDELLWTFAAASFVPHAVYRADTEPPDQAVLIGHVPPPDAWHQLLISLTPQIPEFFSRFARVAEIVGPTENEKAAARERFRFYRERGYALETHSL
ncbi:MAG: DNA polymerase III subunit chi [Gammaproteobacteria bacterium]|nr:DNA polymerase III subunit chi [Gammaproteobacteria bacterium]